ncbi:MAG: 30S ribosomal protein S4 [Deltaproteobacteria bacterium]|nr:30S ribosomal protein S4 [Deltaproteobacteria bacterium]
MAKYCGPVCRLCRREGEKLFLKGERCYTNKCAIERREGAPGQHGKGRQAFSDFKVQFREKQKVKRIFGMLEKSFRKVYEKASTSKGVTGTELLVNLERRLDNIVYRLGFGASRRLSRQLVSHGLVQINGRPVNIPSYQVKVGDVVEIRERNKKDMGIAASMLAAESRVIPEWLALDKNAVKGTVNALPSRAQLSQSVNEQLIVELYSK